MPKPATYNGTSNRNASVITERAKGRAIFADSIVQQKSLELDCKNRIVAGNSANTSYSGSVLVDKDIGAIYTTRAERAEILLTSPCEIAAGNRAVPSLPTIRSDSFTPYNYNTGMRFTGTIITEGSSPIVARGVVWNATGNPTLEDNIEIDSSVGLGSYTLEFQTGFDDIIYARAYATNTTGTIYGEELSAYPQICLAKGTLISLPDGLIKPIEDITYDDDILVWDFDNGGYAIAKPLWIKIVEYTDSYNLLEFSDGSYIKTINQHRIFNKESCRFTQAMADTTPIGTTTFNVRGEEIQLIDKRIIYEPTEYYNIITDYHMNLFANGILTSCRFNNIYPIKRMKFIKDNREHIIKDIFDNLPSKYYEGLRLYEQLYSVDEIYFYIRRLERHKL